MDIQATYKPIEQQDAVERASQALLALLSSDKTQIPGNLVEAVISGKSLLRAIAEGSVVVCELVAQEETAPSEEG